MTRSLRPLLFGSMLLFAFAVASFAMADNPLRLSPTVQSRLGIVTVKLTGQRRTSKIDAFAKVLDPGPLAALEGDLLSAQSAAAASRAEAVRALALNRSGAVVSAKDAEAAVAQAGADAAHLNLLRRRLGLEWGPGIARLSLQRRNALIAALAAGRAALVHVDTPSNEGQAGARSVEIDVGKGSAHGIVLGPARAAEPRLQSSGLIVEVTGPMAILLSVGLTQSAHIDSTSASSGVVIPNGAVIRYRGSDWAYVRVQPNVFERRLLAGPEPQQDGLFVRTGFAPGDEVVTKGAGALFGIEQTGVGRSR